MASNDWQRVEELFHFTCDLTPAARASYFARTCPGEEELCAEVESLIASFQQQAAFLEDPAFHFGLRLLSENSAAALVGQTVGAYRVQRLLGKGGMGEVYLAADTRLGRPVALKFLPRQLTDDHAAKRQLSREAQAVAILDHPNICPVYDLEEADGYSFIVMQYVDGVGLAELIYQGQITPPQALPLALQMVGALAEAHAHGILHRDIKPQNLILTTNGQLKVLDFGLAKVIHAQPGLEDDERSQASRAGLIMGTVAYMSPEQLRAERLDFRSDVFSVGTVLYELVSGKHPFAQGNDAETISAILRNAPPPLPYHLAPGFERIIRKCLEKEKERRYQSASELLGELQTIESGAAPRWSWPRFLPFLVVALLALLMLGGLFAYLRLTARPTLAVLPFINESAGEGLGAEQNFLLASLPENLAQQLSRLRELKVKVPTNVSGYQSRDTDWVRVGRTLAVDAVLVGKARREQNAEVLEVQFIATRDGKKLWEGRYDLRQTDALALQAMVTMAVATTAATYLGWQPSGDEQKLLQVGQTVKAAAYREYLRGRYYWNRRGKENIQQAISRFKQAIDLDPAYALAYTGLADSYVLLPSVAHGEMPTKEAMTLATAAAKQALQIDDTLPEAHTSLGVIKLKYEWRWQEAEAEFRRAIALNPNDAQAHYWYSYLLLLTKQFGPALAESETARDLAPFSSSVRLHQCRARFQTRQYNSAADCLKKIFAEEPDNANARYVLGLVLLEQGQTDAAIETLKTLHETHPALAATALAHAYGRVGKRAEALKLLAEMQARAQQTYLPPQEFAIVYIGLGDYDNAFVWLEKAYHERFAYLPYLNIEPLFDRVRHDARFTDLVQRLNLTP